MNSLFLVRQQILQYLSFDPEVAMVLVGKMQNSTQSLSSIISISIITEIKPNETA